MSQSKWDETISYPDPDPSRQTMQRMIKKAEAIDGVLEDAYTSFCLRLQSGKYDQEKAFKTAVHDYVEAFVNENTWLYDEET